MPKLSRNDLPHNSKVTTHECLYCSITFYANKPFAKYCSDKCRVYYNQKKKLEQQKALEEMKGEEDKKFFESLDTQETEKAGKPNQEKLHKKHQRTSIAEVESRQLEIEW
jgi:hypothetical protein